MMTDSPLVEDLYKDIILDHCRRPHHFGEMPTANRTAEGYNPLCGDRIRLQLRLNDENHICEIQFTGTSCALCSASCSMMTDAVYDQSAETALELFDQFRTLVTSPPLDDPDEDLVDSLGELAALSSVRSLPMRVKCTTLPWHTLRDMLVNGTGDEATTTE